MRRGRTPLSNLKFPSELRRELKHWIREELEQARRTNRIKEAVEWSPQWMALLIDSLMARMPDYFSWVDERLLQSQEYLLKQALQMLIRELYELEYEESQKARRDWCYPPNYCNGWETGCGCECCRCECCCKGYFCKDSESPLYLRTRNAMLREQLTSMFETENRMAILELLAKSAKKERRHRPLYRGRGPRLLY